MRRSTRLLRRIEEDARDMAWLLLDGQMGGHVVEEGTVVSGETDGDNPASSGPPDMESTTDEV